MLIAGTGDIPAFEMVTHMKQAGSRPWTALWTLMAVAVAIFVLAAVEFLHFAFNVVDLGTLGYSAVPVALLGASLIAGYGAFRLSRDRYKGLAMFVIVLLVPSALVLAYGLLLLANPL